MKIRPLPYLGSVATVALSFAALPSFVQADVITPANNGFETPNAGPINTYSSYLFGPIVSGWTLTNSGTGIAAQGSGYNIRGQDGDQAALFQGGDGSIAPADSSASLLYQSLNFVAGIAVVDFKLEARDFAVPVGPSTLSVYLDSTLLGTFSSQAYASFTDEETIAVPVTAGAHTLSFTGKDNSGDGTFLDSVSVNNTPEPASLSLIALGSGALLSRRRVR